MARVVMSVNFCLDFDGREEPFWIRRDFGVKNLVNRRGVIEGGFLGFVTLRISGGEDGMEGTQSEPW